MDFYLVLQKVEGTGIFPYAEARNILKRLNWTGLISLRIADEMTLTCLPMENDSSVWCFS